VRRKALMYLGAAAVLAVASPFIGAAACGGGETASFLLPFLAAALAGAGVADLMHGKSRLSIGCLVSVVIVAVFLVGEFLAFAAVAGNCT
jgi:hypothetical protein